MESHKRIQINGLPIYIFGWQVHLFRLLIPESGGRQYKERSRALRIGYRQPEKWTMILRICFFVYGTQIFWKLSTAIFVLHKRGRTNSKICSALYARTGRSNFYISVYRAVVTLYFSCFSTKLTGKVRFFSTPILTRFNFIAHLRSH